MRFESALGVNSPGHAPRPPLPASGSYQALDEVGTLASELLELVWRRPAWQKDAACRGEDPNAFFPERGQDARPAKAICATCPVQDECRAFGLAERFGIWGGTSGLERKRLRRSAA